VDRSEGYYPEDQHVQGSAEEFHLFGHRLQTDTSIVEV
jgi:hypothetical protein